MAAAVGMAQIKRYGEILNRRKEIIEYYDKALKKHNIQVLSHYGNHYASSGHLYMVRLLSSDTQRRNEVIIELAEKGIAANVHYKPLPMMTAYKNLGFDIENYRNAYEMYHNEITLPLHTLLTNEQVEYITESFLQLYKH